ncbi:unnamed protein product [Urochloa humidicola]
MLTNDASFAASSSASKRRLILELPRLLVVHYTMLAPTPVAGCMKKVNIWQPPSLPEPVTCYRWCGH